MTSPSRRNSIAGETTLLAKPVIGTMLPAPAYLPILSYTPMPVSSAERKTSVMLVAVEAACIPSCSQFVYRSMITWPMAQIVPPTQKARKSPTPISLLGAKRSTSCAYLARSRASSFPLIGSPPFVADGHAVRRPAHAALPRARARHALQCIGDDRVSVLHPRTPPSIDADSVRRRRRFYADFADGIKAMARAAPSRPVQRQQL